MRLILHTELLILILASVIFDSIFCEFSNARKPSIFPLFLLGIWWSGSNRTGAWAGLIAGGSVATVTLVYFITGKYGITLPYHEFINYYLNAWYFAWLGAPLAIVANIIGSKLSKNKTPLEIKKFLAEKVHNYKVN